MKTKLWKWVLFWLEKRSDVWPLQSRLLPLHLFRDVVGKVFGVPLFFHIMARSIRLKEAFDIHGLQLQPIPTPLPTLPPTTSCYAPVSLPFPLLREFLWEEPGQKKRKRANNIEAGKEEEERVPPATSCPGLCILTNRY